MSRLTIRAGWVIPVDPAFRVIRDGEVVVEEGRVVSVGPAGSGPVADGELREFPRRALLPGLVNVHTHVVGSLFRGLTEDRTDGFYGLALPMEPLLGPQSAAAMSRVGVAEVVLGGCTVIHDMFHFPAGTAAAARDLGIRAVVEHKVFDTDLPTIGTGERRQIPEEGERRLEENVALFDEWDGAGDGRVTVWFGAHAADTCSPRLLAAISHEARSRGASMHVHVAQSPEERDYMAARHGTGSIEFLGEQGFLGHDVVAAHVTYATDKGIELLAETDTAVAHCPAILAKRGRFAPVKALYDAGVRVGWGTDWVSMDPWEMMRFGISGARMRYGTIGLLSAREALWRTTMGSAEALGMGDEVGSLEPGKQADLVLVDLDQPHLAPMHDPVATLVYNASRRDVTHVMVGGRLVVEDGNLRTADSVRLVREAQAAAEGIWRAGGLAAAWDSPGVTDARDAGAADVR
jgi:5-methylthioadenosine/S-adenosylhomocysteine deaminase